MSRPTLLSLAWPVVGLSVLLTAACLASLAYIGRLQSDLGESLQADAARLRAAQQAQIHLREYRVHSIVLAAGPTDDRRRQVADDGRRFRAALDALRASAADPDDRADLAEVEAGWARYEAGLDRDTATPPAFPTVAAFAAWTDTHPSRPLLVPCGRLVERAQGRMDATAARSEAQSRWAGRVLLVVGLVGPLGGLAGGYAIARRVARLSARVEAQGRDLLRAEQLAAVGQLAAGIAHEVRNPLTGIKMLVETAIRPTAPTPLTATDLHLIRDEIGRLERTVQGLLDYAKPDPPVRRPHDIRGAVTRAVEVVAARADRAGVALDVAVGSAPLVARIDPDSFASLLTNLLLNALDASPAGGRVGVEATRTADGRVRVAVTDAGPGIPAELRDTLFTPFATTKPAGTGLGLAVARRVAVAHCGTLTAADRPGGGACFTVTLGRDEG